MPQQTHEQRWLYGAVPDAEAARAAMIAAGLEVFPPASEPVRIVNPGDPSHLHDGAFCVVLPAGEEPPATPALKRAAPSFGAAVLGTF